MPVVVHRSRREKLLSLLEDTAKFFEAHYPDYYAFLLRELPKLRSMSRSGYKTPHGEFTVSMKVPTLMFMAMQYLSRVMKIEPEFGAEVEDIQLMTSVWKNLDAHVPISHDKSSLFIPKDQYTKIFGGRRDDV